MASNREDRQDPGSAADTALKDVRAPGPDHQSKPKMPTDLKMRSWRYVFKRSVNEFSRKKCTDLAAGLTYFTMLSIFPALLALVSLLGVVGQAENTTRTLLDMLKDVASEQVVDTLEQPIQQLTSAPSAGFALAAGILGALWSASGYVGAFGRAMNQIYEVQEGRPFIKLKPVLLLITLAMLVIAVVMAILLVVSGPVARGIGQVVGLGDQALLVWNIAKWPVLVIFAVMLVAVLYYGTPNVQQPKFRWISVGSFLALVVLAVATWGFFFYVSNFGNYNATYGAIGGVIVLLLWIWIANLSLLFGAVFDAELERGRELQAGIEAEESIQLPPRDISASEKLAEKEAADIRQGEALRYASELAAEEAAEAEAKAAQERDGT